MREIKFRAWDKEENRWLTPDEFQDWLTFARNLDSGSIQGEPVRIEIDRNDVGLVQFTDLKDKNGKEIYEGDIIGEKEVYFDKKTASFDLKGSNLRLWASAGINEIQGNVYENPELIK